MAGNSTFTSVFTPIADAKKLVNRTVNLFAKISEVGLSQRSKGTDYVVVLRIIDFSSRAPSLAVNIFAKNEESLPCVRSAGDIISLHRVEVKIYTGDIYFVFKKRVSSFALFDGKTNMALNPYQTSTNYGVANCETELLVQLQKLPLEHQSDAGISASISLLKNIEADKIFDLICKIIHVCVALERELILFVWDGTDTCPLAFQTNLDMEENMPTRLRPEPVLLSREILSSFPYVGSVFRIMTSRSYEDIRHLEGRWVKLYNISCQLQSNILIGVMKLWSRTFILSDEDDHVKYRKRIYNERLAANIGAMPLMSYLQSSYITDIDNENVQFATLIEFIADQETHRCKCIVRVVASCPWRGEDLRSPCDGHFRIQLTLEDPTARIHAYLINDDGVKFFGSDSEPEDLTRRMLKLLGANDLSEDGRPLSRNPPWIQCCLMSYSLDENDTWGSRRYRIYGTKLIN